MTWRTATATGPPSPPGNRGPSGSPERSWAAFVGRQHGTPTLGGYHNSVNFARLPATGRFAGPVWLVSALLIAALAATIAWWATQLLAPRPAIAPAADARGAPPDVSSVGRLFGLPGPAGSPGGLSMPASSIVVLGLVSGERGAAVLAIDGQPGKPYMVGGRLPGGELLVEVRPDGIVLDRAGIRVTVPAPPPRDLSILTAGRQGAASGAPPASATQMPTPAAEAGPTGSSAAGPAPGTTSPPPPGAGPGVVVPQPASGIIGAPQPGAPAGAVPPAGVDGSSLTPR